MVPVGFGTEFTVTDVEELLEFPQVFDGVTVMLPVEVPNFTEILVVFCPERIEAPVGTVQV
jgi:hypothetical protein